MKRRLTEKEEQIMNVFWGSWTPLFIREVLDRLPDPKPSYNTVATQIKFLEDKGFLQREPIANTFRYSVKITERQFRGERVGAMVSSYYDNSYMSLVSQFVEEDRMSLDDLKALIAQIEQGTPAGTGNSKGESRRTPAGTGSPGRELGSAPDGKSR